MEKVIRWFVNNSVASNLMMFFIILSGIATIPLLKMEVFPDIEVDIINVTAVYPGATPSDVENAVCIRIEERLQGLDGVKKITATASENVGSVNVEVLPGRSQRPSPAHRQRPWKGDHRQQRSQQQPRQRIH